MKNFILITATVILLALALGCRPTNRHVVISEGSEDWNLRIEYFGKAVFNYDTTAIARISKNGLVKYNHYGRTLVAENGSGNAIIYRIDGSASHTKLSESERAFVAKAVKEMAKKGFNTDQKKD